MKNRPGVTSTGTALSYIRRYTLFSKVIVSSSEQLINQNIYSGLAVIFILKNRKEDDFMAVAKKLPSGSWRVQVFSHYEYVQKPDGTTTKSAYMNLLLATIHLPEVEERSNKWQRNMLQIKKES